jgi:hypothetical protein
VLEISMLRKEIADTVSDRWVSELAVIKGSQSKFYKEGMTVRSPEIRFQGMTKATILVLIGT